jgi:hypothetical protein
MSRNSIAAPQQDLSRQQLLIAATLLALAALFCSTAHAQQAPEPLLSAAIANVDTSIYSSSLSSSDAALPDNPEPQSAQQPEDHVDKQTKRILGIIPNFRAVSANQKLPPQSVREKFSTASEDTFDYSALVLPTVVALYNYESNNTPEFGKGGVAYGRYLWHSVTDQTIENLMVEFIVPAATHEDIRYYTLGSGGFLKRAGYSLSRVVITRSDSGKETFNIGEVVGAGAAAGISTLYYPTRERSIGNTGGQWGLDVGLDAATFMVKEFWPDINHYLFHGKKPFHDAYPGQ